MGTEQFYSDNQANWDDRARVHVDSTMYRVDGYATDPEAVSDIVVDDVQVPAMFSLHATKL